MNSDQVCGQPLLESAGQGGKNLEKQVGTKLLSFWGLLLFTQNRGAFQNGVILIKSLEEDPNIFLPYLEPGQEKTT